jgi:hypothetical protein
MGEGLGVRAYRVSATPDAKHPVNIASGITFHTKYPISIASGVAKRLTLSLDTRAVP